MKKMITKWIKIKNDLDLDLDFEYILKLKNKEIIKPVFLLKNFGAVNGMIIITKYSDISDHIDEINQMGFGYSVLSEGYSDHYDRDSVIDMLSDWGWSGQDEKPTWLICNDEDDC